jgi:hypothetical protein
MHACVALQERLNTVLSQENDKLQSRVLVLEEHNKQLEKVSLRG